MNSDTRYENGMIPKDMPSWQKSLRDVITDPAELLQLLNLDPAQLPMAQKAAQLFPLRVPRGFVARMKPQNLADPLLQQVLPLGDELESNAAYSKDPLQEVATSVNPLPGLLHKYNGRVLITLTGSCAIHCRYCFRRHYPYEDNRPDKEGLDKILAYIQNDTSISELLLSGGDPLNFNDRYLSTVLNKFATINHLQRVRIHSRLPIVLPERITDDFVTAFTSTRLQPVMVIHCNHPQEIDDHVARAIAIMRQKNITVLNQTVLLRGINDNSEVLMALSEKLFSIGVMPYYLHVLDKVHGTGHFDVADQLAKEIYQQLQANLPGYLLPRLVREEPNKPSKTLL